MTAINYHNKESIIIIIINLAINSLQSCEWFHSKLVFNKAVKMTIAFSAVKCSTYGKMNKTRQINLWEICWKI